MSLPINFLTIDPAVQTLINALPEERQDAVFDAVITAQESIREMLGILPPPTELDPIVDDVGEMLLAALQLSPNYAGAYLWAKARTMCQTPRLGKLHSGAIYAACCGLLDAGVTPKALSVALGGWHMYSIRTVCRTEYARMSEWVHKPPYYNELPNLRNAARVIALNHSKGLRTLATR